MKTRQGFVSNSSTASFIVIGIKVNEIEDAKLDEMLHEGHIIEGSKLYFGIAGESPPYIVGLKLRSSDDQMEECEIDMDEAVDMVRKFLKKHKLPSDQIKLYTGTEMC